MLRLFERFPDKELSALIWFKFVSKLWQIYDSRRSGE